MSMPRYTCAESTLTISARSLPASASESALLPEAVGPISSTAGVIRCSAGRRTENATALAPAHEQPVEVRERQLIPRRSSVVAVAGALGHLHLAQKRVHLGNGEAAIGAHRGV